MIHFCGACCGQRGAICWDFAKEAFDISGYRNIDMAFVVVPVEGDTTVYFSVSVDGKVLVGFDGMDEV